METSAVGYSCVLFALIVVSTSKATEYCPLPGLKKVCLPTWQVPLPFLGSGVVLPFNISPFLLLVAMHYLVPKASFVGHLSGIVLGFPLLWGALNWCSPQMLVRLCAAAVLLRARWFRDAPRAGATASSWQTSTFGHVLSAPVSPGGGGRWANRSKRFLCIAVLMTVVAACRITTLSWCVPAPQ